MVKGTPTIIYHNTTAAQEGGNCAAEGTGSEGIQIYYTRQATGA